MRYEQFDFHVKTLHHSEHIARYRRGERPFAVNVEIDLTNGCNHRCSFCQWADYIQASRATLPANLVMKTLREIKALGGRSITFTGGGEPTLHGSFIPILAEAHALGLASGLLTNGSLLRPGWDVELLERLVWLRASMAGGDRESYLAVQGRDDFEIVLANLCRLATAKRTAGRGPDLGVAMLLNQTNAASLPDMVERLISAGVDYLQLRQDMLAASSDKAWWIETALPAIRAAETRARGTTLNVLGARYMAGQGNLDYPSKCHAHHFVIAINAEGFVAFCKNTRDRPAFYLGNLHEETLTTIWERSTQCRALEAEITPANCGTFCKNMDINIAVEDVVRGRAKPAPADSPAPPHRDFL